jgi:hypothetical protein
LKPALKEKNKKAMLEFCFSMLDETTMEIQPQNSAIDEKWFMMTRKNRNYYLLPEEPDPTRAV